jgi:hypothetical protein
MKNFEVSDSVVRSPQFAILSVGQLYGASYPGIERNPEILALRDLHLQLYILIMGWDNAMLLMVAP